MSGVGFVGGATLGAWKLEAWRCASGPGQVGPTQVQRSVCLSADRSPRRSSLFLVTRPSAGCVSRLDWCSSRSLPSLFRVSQAPRFVHELGLLVATARPMLCRHMRRRAGAIRDQHTRGREEGAGWQLYTAGRGGRGGMALAGVGKQAVGRRQAGVVWTRDRSAAVTRWGWAGEKKVKVGSLLLGCKAQAWRGWAAQLGLAPRPFPGSQGLSSGSSSGNTQARNSGDRGPRKSKKNWEGGKPTASGVAWQARRRHWPVVVSGPAREHRAGAGHQDGAGLDTLELAHCRNAGGWLPTACARGGGSTV